MKKPLLCLLLSLLGCQVFAQALYPFRKGDRWGFIDGNGHQKIAADYRGVCRFSDGLAAVRLHGSYGYVNERGQLTIPFRFDYGEPFIHGLAIAYLKGKPYLVDKSGARLFNHNFTQIQPSGQPGLWIVRSQNNQFGLLNQSGHLLLDTVYARIGLFQSGKAVVCKRRGRPGSPGFAEQAGAVDSKGNFVIPFGTYSRLDPIEEGYFVGEYANDTGDYHKKNVFLDPNGKPVFAAGTEDWYIMPESFRSTFSPIAIAVREPDGSHSLRSFRGIIDRRGAMLFSDSTWEEITPFTLNRAFVRMRNEKHSGEERWIMINGFGQQVGNRAFAEVYSEDDRYPQARAGIFDKGMAFVRTANGRWGAIDTNGRYLIAPTDLDSATSGRNVRIAKRIGDLLVLSEDISSGDGKYPYRYGFWDVRRQKLIRPQYFDLDLDSNPATLIPVLTSDEKLAYIDRGGMLVWKEMAAAPSVQPMDIDYMNRGYFYASGLQREDLAGSGGWGKSNNSSKGFQNDVPYKHNDLSIYISNTSKPWRQGYAGRKVYVVNASHDTLYFPAQDSRLEMNVQAMDADGSWKDIEYLPGSWCGNSYHTLALSPGEYWDLTMPVYEGEVKTSLRVKLVYRYTSKLYEGNDNEVLYSNVVEGRINPAQFWRKKEYYPSGLMDPYEE